MLNEANRILDTTQQDKAKELSGSFWNEAMWNKVSGGAREMSAAHWNKLASAMDPSSVCNKHLLKQNIHTYIHT